MAGTSSPLDVTNSRTLVQRVYYEDYFAGVCDANRANDKGESLWRLSPLSCAVKNLIHPVGLEPTTF